MNIAKLFISALVLFLVCTQARALKLLARMTPENLLAAGFAVTIDRQQDGTLALTISRDLTKAPSYPPDSELTVSRSAYLEVSGPSGLRFKGGLAPSQNKNLVVYHFVLAGDSLSSSTFTLSEIDDYKDTERRAHLIGGGTIYEFRLADFARPDVRRDGKEGKVGG